MSINEISNYLINAKIKNEQLKKICYLFSKDYTASQASKELTLSRQTINSYYKILRTLLLKEQDTLLKKLKEDSFTQNSFSIKYLKVKDEVSFFIESNAKIFLLEDKYDLFPNINELITKSTQLSLTKNTKSNSIKMIFNKRDNRYFLLKLFKSENQFQDYLDIRLKKFRGLSKQNLSIHIKELQFRLNYSQMYIYESLLELLNLKSKASTI